MQSRRVFLASLVAASLLSLTAHAQSLNPPSNPVFNLDATSATTNHAFSNDLITGKRSVSWHFLTPTEFASTTGTTAPVSKELRAFSAPNFFESQAAEPTINYIHVNTNGGGPGGSNYVFTFSLSDTTPNFTLHYTLYVCGQPGYNGTTTTGDFEYSCTGPGNAGATAAIYATAPGYTESETIYPSF